MNPPETGPIAGQVVALVFWAVVFAGLFLIFVQSRKDRP